MRPEPPGAASHRLPAYRQRSSSPPADLALLLKICDLHSETVTPYCAVAALSEFASLDAEQAIVQSARGIGPYGHGKRATDTVRISPPIALSA